jgi:hypothetical protein
MDGQANRAWRNAECQAANRQQARRVFSLLQRIV